MNFDLEKQNNKNDDDHENLDRWLISYSDFLTLLFTFFVALYALSVIDQHKAESFSESLKKVFKIIESPIKTELEKSDMAKELETSLKEFEGAVVKEEPRGIVIVLPDKLLFETGKTDLNPQSRTVLDKIINKLKGIKNKISIEGHTDNVPVKNETIKSNWELSTLRALSVLHYMLESGISPERLSATGYGEYRPITDNDTDEGKAKNRRVEIFVLR